MGKYAVDGRSISDGFRKSGIRGVLSQFVRQLVYLGVFVGFFIAFVHLVLPAELSNQLSIWNGVVLYFLRLLWRRQDFYINRFLRLLGIDPGYKIIGYLVEDDQEKNRRAQVYCATKDYYQPREYRPRF